MIQVFVDGTDAPVYRVGDQLSVFAAQTFVAVGHAVKGECCRLGDECSGGVTSGAVVVKRFDVLTQELLAAVAFEINYHLQVVGECVYDAEVGYDVEVAGGGGVNESGMAVVGIP